MAKGHTGRRYGRERHRQTIAVGLCRRALAHHPGVRVKGGALSAASWSCGRYRDLWAPISTP